MNNNHLNGKKNKQIFIRPLKFSSLIFLPWIGTHIVCGMRDYGRDSVFVSNFRDFSFTAFDFQMLSVQRQQGALDPLNVDQIT